MMGCTEMELGTFISAARATTNMSINVNAILLSDGQSLWLTQAVLNCPI